MIDTFATKDLPVTPVKIIALQVIQTNRATGPVAIMIRVCVRPHYYEPAESLRIQEVRSNSVAFLVIDCEIVLMCYAFNSLNYLRSIHFNLYLFKSGFFKSRMTKQFEFIVMLLIHCHSAYRYRVPWPKSKSPQHVCWVKRSEKC